MFRHGITLREVHERLFQPRPGKFRIHVPLAQARRTPSTSVNFLEDSSNHDHLLILVKLSYVLLTSEYKLAISSSVTSTMLVQMSHARTTK